MDKSEQARGRRPAPLVAAAVAVVAVLAALASPSLAWGFDRGHGPGHGHGHFHGHRHHHSHASVWIGSSWRYGPGWYDDPWYRPYAYRYGRPAVIVQTPPVYIEQGGVPTAQMWYYCARPQGYYPYVNSCATPWRAVPPGSVR
ncbi:hypothetical protein [Janthinobacterium sp. PC23-8]|uniref:hypothetical protein n=1 Tax=Janthinobacterium sp. PC23-8 TaxID=2012679 RepID=UPI000B966DF0|nr:hypothetical protein [Janthinobacterium sp. PC23-8]OYO26361.1 hypothetical protein CD932_24270 [Janthinobacterium sp. PC23-8]